MMKAKAKAATAGVNFTNILCAEFFEQKFLEKLFCGYILGLNFFW
jgi:hypothetical protein